MHAMQLADSVGLPLQHNWIAGIFMCLSQGNPALLGAHRSQNHASELKLQMDLSNTFNTGYYRDPSNSPWLRATHIHIISGKVLKLSPCSELCVTSEARQRSQAACLLHGPSLTTCFRMSGSVNTAITSGFVPISGGNEAC